MASRRIDDHGSWVGEAPSREKPFPDGSKSKKYESADGAGRIMNYPDMDPMIKRVQEESARKIKGRDVKEGYRY